MLTGEVIVEVCSARAALAGNPSDAYGGAVLAVPVDAYRARVSLRSAQGFELTDAAGDVMTFATWDELAESATRVVEGDPQSLVLASIAVATQIVGPIEPLALTTTTTIPRTVGLAGSSAIVIAGLRALVRHAGRPAIPPDELASIALHVERDVLQIPAGLQDRVVQAYDRPMMMRFASNDRRHVGGADAGVGGGADAGFRGEVGVGGDRYQPITPGRTLRLFVAHRVDAAEKSQITHGDLRDRFDAGEAAVVAAMRSLATEAELAAVAFSEGSSEMLGAAMDRTFDLRRSIIELRPEHVEMVEVARHVGAFANYTGSGGAVIVLCPDAECEHLAAAALRSIGCEITPV